MKRPIIPKRRRLGEILVRRGRITPEQMTEFLRIQKETGQPLGQVLVDQEVITKEELAQVLGEQLGIPHVWLRKGLVDPRIVSVLPKEKALSYQVIPTKSCASPSRRMERAWRAVASKVRCGCGMWRNRR